jgi:hypothetical protein
LLKASSLFLNFSASVHPLVKELLVKSKGDEPLIMLSISLDESFPTELEMVMLALRPEVFSVAVTLRIR